MLTLKCLATGSTGNCYILNVDGCQIILDAGCDWNKIVTNVDLTNIDFAYISHEHKDHSLNLENLRLRGILIFDGINTQEFTKKQNLSLKHANLSLYLIPIFHGKTNNCALVIKTDNECVLYATDFSLCEYDLSPFKFTHILVECNYLEEIANLVKDDIKVRRQINTHMGLDGLQIFLDTLDLSKCREIDLIHISEGLGDSITMGTTIYFKYKIKTGVCKKRGGIEYYG